MDPDSISTLRVGTRVYVSYSDTPGLWHERLLLGKVSGTSFIVATPDLDLYEEDLAATAAGVHVVGPRGGAPLALKHASRYAFNREELAAAQDDLLARGAEEARNARAAARRPVLEDKVTPVDEADPDDASEEPEPDILDGAPGLVPEPQLARRKPAAAAAAAAAAPQRRARQDLVCGSRGSLQLSESRCVPR